MGVASRYHRYGLRDLRHDIPQIHHDNRADSSLRSTNNLTVQREFGVRWGSRRRLWEWLRADHLMRNSLSLILNSVLQAAFGFAFWIITARLFSTADVGRASSLISATSLISYVALLGLSSTFVRYLPTASNRDALITAGLCVVGVGGGGISLLYVLATPVLAPALAFVERSLPLMVGFVLLTAAAAINLVTDSVFIASRKAGYNVLADGVVGGVTKLVFSVALAGTGAYGVFCASAGGFAASALASIVLMITVLHCRPSLRNPLQALKPVLRFSGANYVAETLNLLPNLVVPLIILDRLGASIEAYYFVAFQMAVILYSAGFAVTATFLAEGSHDEQHWRKLLRRGRRLMMALCLPGCLVLVVAAHWMLLVFGARYSQNAAESLIVLAVAALPIAANNWWHTVLRLLGRLVPLVLSSGVCAIAICGLAWFLAPYGLATLTAAWPIGSLLGGAVAAVPVWLELRRRPQHGRRGRLRGSGRPGIHGNVSAAHEAKLPHGIAGNRLSSVCPVTSMAASDQSRQQEAGLAVLLAMSTPVPPLERPDIFGQWIQ